MLFKRKMYHIVYEDFILIEKRKRLSCVSAFTRHGAIKKIQKYYYPVTINILDIKEVKL